MEDSAPKLRQFASAEKFRKRELIKLLNPPWSHLLRQQIGGIARDSSKPLNNFRSLQCDSKNIWIHCTLAPRHGRTRKAGVGVENSSISTDVEQLAYKLINHADVNSTTVTLALNSDAEIDTRHSAGHPNVNLPQDPT
ncbi:hypothetical protein GCM10009559_67610 [Pseudonocardia zijingensis]|uniref:Uncharacterized protein n=1 Tax=Pseudonocardia zijingensis TaxID=153376 RepID=A0ABP3YP63_9PSEU